MRLNSSGLSMCGQWLVPVITFSGIPANNDHLIHCGAGHRFEKSEVIRGDADVLMKELLRISE